jgi:hypothetical protein
MSITGLFIASFFSAFRHFSDLGFIDIDPEKVSAIGPPTNGYVLEDGVTAYITEDGAAQYVTEA